MIHEYAKIMDMLLNRITVQYGSLAAFSKATGIGGPDGKTLSRNFRRKAGRHLSLGQFLAICRALNISELASPTIGECFQDSSNFTLLQYLTMERLLGEVNHSIVKLLST